MHSLEAQEWMGTLFLAFAIVNTLFTKKIKNLAFYFPKKSLFHSLFYLLGEVELAFGFWSWERNV